MPIYEYQCENCGHQMEKIQKMSDDPLTDCPACEKPALRKLVSAAAFKLKGSGWYETDFKDKDKSKTMSTPTDSAEKSSNTEKDSAAGDKKAETPAAKPVEKSTPAKKAE